MASTQTVYEDREEIQLTDWLIEFWRVRNWIVGTTFVVTLLTIIVVLQKPNIYVSEVLLSPVVEEKGSALSGLVGQFGGLASSVGIDLGGSSSDKTTLAFVILKSKVFLSNFIHKHELLVPLMATEGWNKEKQEWIINEDIYDAQEKKWITTESPTEDREFLEWQAYLEFADKVEIIRNPETKMVTLSVTSRSPVYAQKWVALLVGELNQAIRGRDVKEATKSITFLTSQLEHTVVADMRKILYQLIEQQMQKLMLAEVRDGYVFQIIDPPLVPRRKIGPMRTRIVIIGTMLGFILSLFGVSIIRIIRMYRNEKPG